MTGTAEQRNVIWMAQPGSQRLFTSCPAFEVLYEGPRGPGKTDGLIMDYAQFTGRGYGEAWRGILFRRTYKQLDDVIAKTKKYFFRAFPDAVFNKSSHEWEWPTGERLLLRYMDQPDDYWNYHGHEYPWIGWEELTNWPTDECYISMFACCRSSNEVVPRRVRSTANPYGVGHNWVRARFIDVAPTGAVYHGQSGTRVRITGHWSENRALLEADPDYPKRLAGDRNVNRRKAWLSGRWDIVAGGMFDDVWDERTNMVPPFEVPASWRIDRAFDWGDSKPFSVGWWAESDGTAAPDGFPYPRGSLFRIAEWYGWTGHPNEGLRLTDTQIADGIVEREKAMGLTGRVRPGPADSAIFYAEPGRETIADAMAKRGVYFVEADKRPGSRIAGWTVMRRMMLAGMERSREHPGLYVFTNCVQFKRCVPTLPRDDRKYDDVDTNSEDHIGDETRYRVRAPRGEAAIVRAPVA